MDILSRLGNFFYGVLDAFTGAPITYEATTAWGDGSPMTDAKCDGVLWRKSADGTYLRRVLEDNVIQAEWFGVRAGNGVDNALLLNFIVSRLPEDTGYTIQLPRGIINCQSTIILEKRNIWLRGVRGATELRFPASVVGIRARGVYGGDNHKISQLAISATSRNNSDGVLNGVRSADGLFYQYNAIEVSCVGELEDLAISGFSGNGVFSYGNLADKTPTQPQGSNSSHAYYKRVEVRGCGGSSFYTVGSDANSLVFEACSGRDAGLANFDDYSFLGCRFINCLAHRANVWNLPGGPGHYMLRDNNSSGSVLGCYGEGDSPPSYAAGSVTVTGGTHANEWIKGSYACVQQGNDFSSIRLGGISMEPNQFRFTSANSGSAAPLFLRNMDTSGNLTNYKLSDAESFGDPGIYEFFQAFASPSFRRAQARPGWAVRWQYVGDVLQLSMNRRGRNSTFANGLPLVLTYAPGDQVLLTNAGGHEPSLLVCEVAGGGENKTPAKWRVDSRMRGTTAQRPDNNPEYSFFGEMPQAFIGCHYWNYDLNGGTGGAETWNGTTWLKTA